MVESVIFDMDGTLFQTDRILELSLVTGLTPRIGQKNEGVP